MPKNSPITITERFNGRCHISMSNRHFHFLLGLLHGTIDDQIIAIAEKNHPDYGVLLKDIRDAINKAKPCLNN